MNRNDLFSSGGNFEVQHLTCHISVPLQQFQMKPPLTWHLSRSDEQNSPANPCDVSVVETLAVRSIRT